MEVELARKQGSAGAASIHVVARPKCRFLFLLGEVYTDLVLPVDGAVADHCGTCEKCMAACPSGAILGVSARCAALYLLPYDRAQGQHSRGTASPDRQPRLWLRRLPARLPVEPVRARTPEADFAVRNGLDAALVELFSWSEELFNTRLLASPIRRIGHERWLRNLAVGLGNAPRSTAVVDALKAKRDHPSALVREHAAWALERQQGRE
jgi:epoxyqueuosine reductase